MAQQERAPGIVRVRPARLGGPCAVRHPEHGELIVPAAGAEFSAEDPLVKAFPWLFVTDTDLAENATPEHVESVPIAPMVAKSRTRRGR